MTTFTVERNIRDALIDKFNAFYYPQLRIKKKDWIRKVANTIRKTLPNYNFLILHEAFERNEISFTDIVFEWACVVEDCCYHVIIFREGRFQSYKKRVGITEWLYGGPMTPILTKEKIQKTSHFFKFCTSTISIWIVDFKNSYAFDKEKEMEEALKVLREVFNLKLPEVGASL